MSKIPDIDALRRIAQNFEQSFIFRESDLLDQIFEKGTRTALDIGTNGVRVIQIQGTPKGPVIKAAGYHEFLRPPEAKGSLPEEAMIMQVLNDLWQETKIKERTVRLVISDPAIYIRHINIPRVGTHELQKAIRWQAEKFAPFSIEGASVDYQIVEKSAKGEENQMEIILVAVEKKIIDKYLNILKVVKLVPSTIDIAPFTVAKAVMRHYPVTKGHMALVIDIGHKTTSVVIVKADSLRLVRTIEIAGYHLTQAIAAVLPTEKSESEKIKKELNVAPEQPPAGETPVTLAVKTVLQELLKEINRSLAYCEQEFMAERIEKVILCGGGAQLKGLDKFLNAALGLTVIVADPLKDNKLVSPQMMACLGATL